MPVDGGGGSSGRCFGERDGVIMIEAEDTTMAGDWVKSSDVAGFTGSGYVVYMGPDEYKFAGSAPSSCLLYTSPSPRDKRQSRMPSSA